MSAQLNNVHRRAGTALERQSQPGSCVAQWTTRLDWNCVRPAENLLRRQLQLYMLEDERHIGDSTHVMADSSEPQQAGEVTELQRQLEQHVGKTIHGGKRGGRGGVRKAMARLQGQHTQSRQMSGAPTSQTGFAERRRPVARPRPRPPVGRLGLWRPAALERDRVAPT